MGIEDKEIEKKFYDHTCLCGCGCKIEIKSYHLKTGYIPQYIRGHCRYWKGKKRPDSSIRMQQNNPTKKEDVRQKISHSNKVRIISDETRKKLSISHSGKNNYLYKRCMPEWMRENLKGKRPHITGVNHWNWKGGVSFEPYCQIWGDNEYKKSIMERDGYKCLNPECNKLKQKDLCIHHINYNKKDCHPKNLITICKSCNCKANFDRYWHESWYRAILVRRYGI